MNLREFTIKYLGENVPGPVICVCHQFVLLYTLLYACDVGIGWEPMEVIQLHIVMMQ